jgi:hypothetical protein
MASAPPSATSIRSRWHRRTPHGDFAYGSCPQRPALPWRPPGRSSTLLVNQARATVAALEASFDRFAGSLDLLSECTVWTCKTAAETVAELNPIAAATMIRQAAAGLPKTPSKLSNALRRLARRHLAPRRRGLLRRTRRASDRTRKAAPRAGPVTAPSPRPAEAAHRLVLTPQADGADGQQPRTLALTQGDDARRNSTAVLTRRPTAPGGATLMGCQMRT